MIKKSLLLSIATLGIGMCVVTVHPHAASIEHMKANVNVDTCAIFSEELGRDMTKSEADLYFETVSQEQRKLGLSTSQVTPEIDKAARQVVAENTKKPVVAAKDKTKIKSLTLKHQAISPVKSHVNLLEGVWETIQSVLL